MVYTTHKKGKFGMVYYSFTLIKQGLWTLLRCGNRSLHCSQGAFLIALHVIHEIFDGILSLAARHGMILGIHGLRGSEILMCFVMVI